MNLAVVLAGCLVGAEPTLDSAGMFIKDSTLPGERRADDVVPSRASCIQAARNRWIIVYYTHGFRGVDDERSIMYQVRADAPDGRVLKEGFLARTITDWKPEGTPPAPEGKVYFKQHGHEVAFGVPKGARIGGKPVPHANLFVAQWRIAARVLDPKLDYLEHGNSHRYLYKTAHDVEWVQFRLNDANNDIDIVEPTSTMRPATGKLPDGGGTMNQSFCMPVPMNERADSWLVCNHFANGALAVLKLQFDAATGRYAWTETSPFLTDKRQPFEASLAPFEDGWLVSARTAGAIAWFRAKDPLARWPAATFLSEPRLSAPHTTFRCADGIVRLFGGDAAASPQRYDRDPMYLWDVTPAGKSVELSNRRVVFDSEREKLPIRRAVRSRVHFASLFPPHGREQIVAFSVTPRANNFPYGKSIPPIQADEKAASGLYHVKLRYAEDVPQMWRFE